MSPDLVSCSRERSTAPAAAFRCANSLLNSLGIQAKFARKGGEVGTHYCELVDVQGYNTSGFGKGLGEQSVVSALCEALEHYLHENDQPLLELRTYHLDESCQLAQSSLGLERFSNVREPLSFYSAEYQSLVGPDSPTRLPIFMTDVNYTPQGRSESLWLERLGLLRYSTNSGTASGVGLDDALLHGVLELVERDAIGIELLRTVVRREPASARIVRHDSLPEQLAVLVALVIEELGGELTIYDCTTDLGVPVFLAELEQDTTKHFGSGASLSGAYALERAILEAVQVCHADEFIADGMMPACRRQLGGLLLPRYSRAYLEAGIFDFQGGAEDVPWSHSEPRSGTVSDQLGKLATGLASRGIEVFYRTVWSEKETQFCVAQVVAPRLERFHLISHGVPVAPGPRARTHLGA